MKLIFVYNADSGVFNALKDGLHKLISPKTYPCKLCDLTYGAFSEKTKWKKFRKTFDGEMIFLHADEFYKQYKSKFLPKYELPIVLLQNDYDFQILINRDAMETCENLDDFIKLITNALTH